MAMSVNKLMVSEGSGIFYTQEWMVYLESHLQWLRSLSNSIFVKIEPHDAHKYEADLIGLLQKIGIPMEHHLIVMRMNGLTSPAEYRDDMLSLQIPDRSTIGQLVSLFRTKTKKIT